MYGCSYYGNEPSRPELPIRSNSPKIIVSAPAPSPPPLRTGK